VRSESKLFTKVQPEYLVQTIWKTMHKIMNSYTKYEEGLKNREVA
jgi:hypothetical protein